uniref:Uncharacterized protein n=1 Tax=Arundo donax TaxID=35708 RepID=A0A0A9HP12_ARUDO
MVEYIKIKKYMEFLRQGTHCLADGVEEKRRNHAKTASLSGANT